MAILSTLRNQLYSTLVPDTLSTYSQDLQSAASIPSMFCPQDVTLPFRPLTGELHHEHIPPPLSATYVPALGYDHVAHRGHIERAPPSVQGYSIPKTYIPIASRLYNNIDSTVSFLA
ncbi:hypothetical protein PTTW11_00742 [Pyrenophora teres f. teres]|uniref:Uncharacterized protein n=1 Tax=Pyrenophora teres f. teres TaxID=97479 RepID=A0A6S6VPJ0_9PLEO|nr:hypothetical protein PTTW11_00742 [Pyrenophora teres f. teres]